MMAKIKEEDKDKLNSKFECWLRAGIEIYEGDDKNGKL